MSEIAACPFCGASPTVDRSDYGSGDKWIRISCPQWFEEDDDAAPPRRCFGASTRWARDDAGAFERIIAAWNARRSTAPLESRCLNPRCDGRHVTSAEWTPNGPGHVPMRPLGNRLDVRALKDRFLRVRSRLIGEGYTQGIGIELNAIADELSALLEGK